MSGLKIVYHVYAENLEMEGMFDQDGNLLAMWCLNDANWRNEYFDGFMTALGVTITSPPERMYKKLLKHMQDAVEE